MDLVYHDKTLELMKKIELLTFETKTIEKIINEKKLARHRLDDIRKFLNSNNGISEFNDVIFKQMIEGITV